ncbi:hypothetical protein [Ekhidna sp.]|uniref:hypothetical protein n=1 Tax=Ekhidna sp. TaxID=2608089 RepID=UPI003519A0B9
MRKIKNTIYGLIVLSLASFSCGDDDGGSADYIAQFVGTWQSSIITSTGCSNPDENGTLNCDPYCFQITIESDGSYTLIDAIDQTTETGTLTATESRFTLCTSGNTNCQEGEDGYSFSNATTFTATFTDDESPGCVFSATFNKQ